MSLTVGHNDSGYEPLDQPVKVEDINSAVQTVCQIMAEWFSPEMEGEEPELTQTELQSFLNLAYKMRPKTRLVIRKHEFWIH